MKIMRHIQSKGYRYKRVKAWGCTLMLCTLTSCLLAPHNNAYAINYLSDSFTQKRNASLEKNHFYFSDHSKFLEYDACEPGYSLINSQMQFNNQGYFSRGLYFEEMDLSKDNDDPLKNHVEEGFLIQKISGTYSKFYATLGDDSAFYDRTKMHVKEIGDKPYKDDSYKGFGEIGITLNPYGNEDLKLNLGIKKIYENSTIRGTWLSIESNYNF